MVGVAIAGSAAIGAGASLIAGSQQASAAKDAAKLQQEATLAGIEEQRRQFNLTRQDFGPYREVGYDALGVLADLFLPGGRAASGLAAPGAAPAATEPTINLPPGAFIQDGRVVMRGGGGEPPAWMGYGPQGADEVSFRTRGRSGPLVGTGGGGGLIDLGSVADFQAEAAAAGGAAGAGAAGSGAGGPDYSAFFKSPGYEFRFGEGLRALDRSASARGGLRSGGFARELTRYGQGFASNEFNNYANRVASLAGIGQSATGSTAAFGQSSADAISGLGVAGAARQGQFLQDAGTARASGYVGAANSLNSGMQNFLLMKYLQNQPAG